MNAPAGQNGDAAGPSGAGPPPRDPDGARRPHCRPISRVLIALVRLYQGSLSRWLGGHCRYVPSCSEYFIQAVRLYGPLRGGLRGLRRICRCHPFAKGGYDPVE